MPFLYGSERLSTTAILDKYRVKVTNTNKVKEKRRSNFLTGKEIPILQRQGGRRRKLAPAIHALKGSVKAAAGLEVIPEESPVGESQSNGRGDRAVRTVRGQGLGLGLVQHYLLA